MENKPSNFIKFKLEQKLNELSLERKHIIDIIDTIEEDIETLFIIQKEHIDKLIDVYGSKENELKNHIYDLEKYLLTIRSIFDALAPENLPIKCYPNI